MPGDRLTAALAAVTAWPVSLAPGEDFMPLAELDLDAYVSAIGVRLGGPPPRVAESAAVMGIASRLWSAALMPAVTHGIAPSASDLLARHVDGALELGLRSTTAVQADPAYVHAIAIQVLEPVIERLRVSSTLLWANVAASLHAVPRVQALPSARAWCEQLLDADPLRGHLDVRGGVARRRTTCCLFYRVPGATVCGDCVFDAAPQARRR